MISHLVLIICQCIPGQHLPFFDLSPFFSICLLPFLVSLSVFCARKFCLLESLFLNKNSNQIDLLYLNLIIFILCNGSSIGWVAVAVADAYSMGWVAVAVSMAATVAVMAVQKAAMPLPFDGWWWRGGGPKGVAQASFDQGVVSFFVLP
jgi:hypothetical protein